MSKVQSEIPEISAPSYLLEGLLVAATHLFELLCIRKVQSLATGHETRLQFAERGLFALHAHPQRLRLHLYNVDLLNYKILNSTVPFYLSF